GLGLLGIVLALSLTGYLLPWDQKGYWATRVATNIAAITPVIGPDLQRLIIGGADYGHHTLTRFFALHAGWLPAALIALIVGHIYLFRRHGLTAAEPRRKKDEPFWPDQVLKDSVAALAVMATVLLSVILPRFMGSDGEVSGELSAPADPSEQFSAARPEWYFLFLFQLLKYFPGESEVWGAIILPSFVMVLIFLMPFFGKWRLGHRFNVALLVSIIAGAGLLTWLAMSEDSRSPEHQLAIAAAERDAKRVKILAQSPAGIPSSGAVTLLRNDPYTQGPKLFAKNCASCHLYEGHDGQGVKPKDPATAPDLKGFATREWIAGLLDPEKVSSPHYFGGTRFTDGKMARFVKREIPKLNAEGKQDLQAVIAALSAEARLKAQTEADTRDAALIARGREAIRNSTMQCTECHSFQKPDEDATAPDLTGYGSRQWIIDFVKDPAHDRFYGKRNDRMPRFGVDQILDDTSIGLIADWLRGDWYEPARGTNTNANAAN
ncbi:MAG: c-type cytochrome, partial [Verrucomicrobia bacterium]|nr:c-type cytochrome [Verrucomicrobiota bacterium]